MLEILNKCTIIFYYVVKKLAIHNVFLGNYIAGMPTAGAAIFDFDLN